MHSLPVTKSRRVLVGLAIASTIMLAGCSSEKWGFPYRYSVQQGNWVTQEQVDTLQVGMTREQVRFVLGSPTLTSVLHADRWDYPYYYTPGTGTPQERKFTVWFENDLLARWQGDDQPSVQPFQQSETPSEVLDNAQQQSAPPADAQPGGQLEIHPVPSGSSDSDPAAEPPSSL